MFFILFFYASTALKKHLHECEKAFRCINFEAVVENFAGSCPKQILLINTFLMLFLYFALQ